MKFSAIAIIAVASVGQVEGAKLHSLERAEIKSQMAAMSEQMELLQQQMQENQQSLAEVQNWWNHTWNTVKSWF